MTSLILLVLVGGMISMVSATTTLTVTCNYDVATGVGITVSKTSWGDFTKLYVANHPGTLTTIVGGTTEYTIAASDFSSTINLGDTFTIQAVESSTYIKTTDLSETWTCIISTDEISQVVSQSVNPSDSDPTGSDAVAATLSLSMVSAATGTAFSSPQTIGTSAKLVVALGTAYQGIYAFRIEAVHVKIDGQLDTAFISLYGTDKCTTDSALVGNPNVQASTTEIEITTTLFRLSDATLSSASQSLQFKVTVQPCDTVTNCQTGACASSPTSRRRKRSAGGMALLGSNMEPHNVTASVAVLPPGVTRPESANGQLNRDVEVEEGEELCFGRAPVYAMSAVVVAILLAATCMGCVCMLLKNRRREKKRQMVETPYDVMSVASVQPHGRM